MDKRLFFLISKARHNLHKRMDGLMEVAVGISITQVAALLALEARDGRQMKDIGRFLGLNKSAVTGLVGRMEKNRLLKKKADAFDGRAARVFMTARGREILGRAKPVIKAENARMLRGYNQAETAVILRFLNGLAGGDDTVPAGRQRSEI